LLSDFLSGDDDNADDDDDVVIVNDDDHDDDDAHPLMTSSPQSILSVINVIVFAESRRQRTRCVLFIFMLFSINNFT